MSNLEEKKRAEKEEGLAKVRKDYRAIKDVPQELKGDRELVLFAAQHLATVQDGARNTEGWQAIFRQERGQERLMKVMWDQEVALALVQIVGWAFRHASKELRGDKQVVNAAVQQYGKALHDAAKEPRGNQQVVPAAVQQYGGALEHASEALRGDKDVVLAAMQQHGGAVECATRDLPRDEGLDLAWRALGGDEQEVFAAVRQEEKKRADKEEWLAKVRKDYRAIKDAPQEHQGDMELVLFAARHLATLQDGPCGEEGLRAMFEGCLGKLLQTRLGGLMADREVALALVQILGALLGAFGSLEALRGDKDVVLAAVQQDGWALQYATEKIKNNKDEVLRMVAVNGMALEFVPLALRRMKDVQVAAATHCGLALQHVPGELQCESNRDVVLAAVHQDCKALEWAVQEAHKNETMSWLLRDNDVALAAMKQEDGVKHLPDVFHKAVEAIISATSQPNAHELGAPDAIEQFARDRSAVIAASRSCGASLIFASPDIANDSGVAEAADLGGGPDFVDACLCTLKFFMSIAQSHPKEFMEQASTMPLLVRCFDDKDPGTILNEFNRCWCIRSLGLPSWCSWCSCCIQHE